MLKKWNCTSSISQEEHHFLFPQTEIKMLFVCCHPLSLFGKSFALLLILKIPPNFEEGKKSFKMWNSSSAAQHLSHIKDTRCTVYAMTHFWISSSNNLDNILPTDVCLCHLFGVVCFKAWNFRKFLKKNLVEKFPNKWNFSSVIIIS